MKLTQEKMMELLWNYNGDISRVQCTGPDFKGTTQYMVFGARLFINRFGICPETGEQVFETREAETEETREYVRRQLMAGKFEFPREELKPDFSKLAFNDA